MEAQTAPVAFAPASDAALEACIRLAAGPKDEERFLGATLALQHAASLAEDASARNRLSEALGPAFAVRLLNDASVPYRRIGLALFRALAIDGKSAELLARSCAVPLVEALRRSLEIKTVDEQANVDEVETDAAGPAEEVSEVVEALRQAVRLLKHEPQTLSELLASALDAPLGTLTDQVRSVEPPITPPALLSVLSLLQELSCTSFVSAAADALLQGVCLSPVLRGSKARGLALGVLSDRIETGTASSTHLSDILGEQLIDAQQRGVSHTTHSSSADGEDRWQVCASTLRLASIGLQRQSLGLFGGAEPESLKRLQAMLKLAAGEVHLGLEGLAPLEALCAGCMFAEAATTALVNEADTLEQGRALEASSECLRALHRIVQDAYDYCLDIPENAVPSALPIVARLIGVWQVEDPMRFASEFQRSLPVLCRLPPAEFEVLLPSLHELQDWHLTPGLGKSLELLSYSLDAASSCNDAQSGGDHGSSDGRRALMQSCALGLAEVSLDAAAYLPDAPLPVAPATPRSAPRCESNRFETLAATIGSSNIPRPAVASDPTHPGVVRLCAWSAWLWAQGCRAQHFTMMDRSLLGLVCGSLLTSVPDAALVEFHAEHDMWRCVAEFVLGPSSVEIPAEAAAGVRLALRLCGFALDRHPNLAHALVAAAAALQRAGKKWLPKALRSSGDDETDEWKVVDDMAIARVRNFLKAAEPVFKEMQSSPSVEEKDRKDSPSESTCLASMD
jgi:hypothetical protein